MADWNAKYRRGEHTADEPHRLVIHFASRLIPGRALDVACGVGRHAIWLAERGWDVRAVDYSSVAIGILVERARAKGVVIDARVADLERHEFTIEKDSYDLIVLCNYLQRDLFAPVKQGTRTRGHVIAVIPLVDDDPTVKPMNPAYLMHPGELRAQFDDWELISYFEGKSKAERRRATAELVARRAD